MARLGARIRRLEATEGSAHGLAGLRLIVGRVAAERGLDPATVLAEVEPLLPRAREPGGWDALKVDVAGAQGIAAGDVELWWQAQLTAAGEWPATMEDKGGRR